MRDLIALCEGPGRRFTAETGQPFSIIENPTPQQLPLVFRSGYGGKALLSPDKRRILVWDAYHAQHFDAWALWNKIPIEYGETGDVVFDPAFMNQIALEISQEGVQSDSADLDAFKDAPCLRRMFDQPFIVSDSTDSETITPTRATLG